MTLTHVETPRLLATILVNDPFFTVRVLSGHINLGASQQEVQNEDGLSVFPPDGVLNLRWPLGQLWVSGHDATMQVILP